MFPIANDEAGACPDGAGDSRSSTRIVALRADEVVHTVGLRKVYVSPFRRKKVAALEGLDLQVKAGEVFGLLGPNGAGKSTAIKLLIGLIKPTSGALTLFGRQPGDNEARRAIGYLAENPSFYPYLTAHEFMDYCGSLLGLGRRSRTEQTGRLLDELGLWKSRSLRVKKMSKGMLQRLGFAQALLGDPRLLILDEPMSGLDPLGRRIVREKIFGMKSRGGTVLFSSHILPDVETVCDRVGILVGGKLQRVVELDAGSMDEDPPVELVMDRLDPRLIDEVRRTNVTFRRRGDTYILQFKGAGEAQSFLSGAVARGGRVLSYSRLRESLERLFLKEIEPESREGDPGSEREELWARRSA